MEHKDYRAINKPVRKKDSMQLLLGKPVYTDDITPRDALVVKLLRSPHANAIVQEIDTSLAKKVPGVAATALVLSDVTLPVWWFGDAETCDPTEDTG